MLEKIGLPAKPALKGNEWATDAPNCQGCSSAFTFFNRKHHCRRCGGIFCGSCTQQRMVLRGQGEGPVRICDPCKKLEDAAKFERYGHRKRTSTKVAGSSRPAQETESDSLLKEILGDNSESDRKTELMDQVDELIGSSTSARQSLALENDSNESTPVTPEALLLQAQEHKQKWLALKKQGKNEEALQAFKRGKELERQAESLKLSLRRSHRKVTRSAATKEKREVSVLTGKHDVILTKEKHEVNKPDQKVQEGILTAGTGEAEDKSETGVKKIVRVSKKNKSDNDDILDALKDIGWNDADLEDSDRKRGKNKTVEGELAELASTIHGSSGNTHTKPTTSMEVLAHKRRAVALKKEGNMVEAKEELKKAKVLERQLEEQQMFGREEDESEDELTELIRGLDKEGAPTKVDFTDLDFSLLSKIDDHDYADDEQGMDVTDIDMDDPELAATLRSLGWEEEATEMERNSGRKLPKKNKSSSVNPKLDGDLFSMDDNLDNVEATDEDLNDPYYLSALGALGFDEQEPSKFMDTVFASIPKPSGNNGLQQEILSLKKEALSLKRAGKLQEAKEELRRAKQLEKQFKNMQTQYNDEEILEAFSMQHEHHEEQLDRVKSPEPVYSDDDHSQEGNVDVTEEDMKDPELAKTLKSLGWQDDDENEKHTDTYMQLDPSDQQFYEAHKSKTRPQLQKELLGIKRTALKLRREGKLEAAEEELKKGELIERIVQDVEKNADQKHPREQRLDPSADPKNDGISQGDKEGSPVRNPSRMKVHVEDRTRGSFAAHHGTNNDQNPRHEENQSIAGTSNDVDFNVPHGNVSGKSSNKSEPQWNVTEVPLRKSYDKGPNEVLESPQVIALQQEILLLKKRALTCKREGKVEDAKMWLREAKSLEKNLSEGSQPEVSVSNKIMHEKTNPGPSVSSTQDHASSKSASAQKHTASKDRMKLQRESLAHKRKALALRREGKTTEADAEFELAKSIEKQMEELAGTETSFASGDDAGSVDDIFDPDLLNALKGLGWNDAEIFKPAPKVETDADQMHSSRIEMAGTDEKKKLEEKIKSEKLRAVQLKRAGRQAEALDVLRGAKQLEQRLQSMN